MAIIVASGEEEGKEDEGDEEGQEVDINGDTESNGGDEEGSDDSTLGSSNNEGDDNDTSLDIDVLDLEDFIVVEGGGDGDDP